MVQLRLGLKPKEERKAAGTAPVVTHSPAARRRVTPRLFRRREAQGAGALGLGLSPPGATGPGSEAAVART